MSEILPPETPPIPGSSTSATDLIGQAMRALGKLPGGQSPTGAEFSDALVTLNQMIDGCNAERLLIWGVERSTPYALTAGQQDYTLGPNPTALYNISQVRPVKIQGIGILSLNNPLQPLELPLEILDDYQWAAIPVKNTPSTLPLQVLDDEGFPFRTLSMWPVPSTIVQLVYYSWVAITQFANVKTRYTFPPAYVEFLRYNLAIRLAPEYGIRDINPLIVSLALEARGKIETFNAPILELRCDNAIVGTGGTYNWLTDRSD